MKLLRKRCFRSRSKRCCTFGTNKGIFAKRKFKLKVLLCKTILNCANGNFGQKHCRFTHIPFVTLCVSSDNRTPCFVHWTRSCSVLRCDFNRTSLTRGVKVFHFIFLWHTRKSVPQYKLLFADCLINDSCEGIEVDGTA